MLCTGQRPLALRLNRLDSSLHRKCLWSESTRVSGPAVHVAHLCYSGGAQTGRQGGESPVWGKPPDGLGQQLEERTKTKMNLSSCCSPGVTAM